jgi:iron only hydrogenase large subunit-like protein
MKTGEMRQELINLDVMPCYAKKSHAKIKSHQEQSK